MCSGVFISKREEKLVYKEDILANNMPILLKLAYQIISIDVNYEEQSVTAKLLGLFKRKVIFYPGFGCNFSTDSILINNFTKTLAIIEDRPVNTLIGQNSSLFYKKLIQNNTSSKKIDFVKLNNAIKSEFSENDENQTRAIVVIKNGYIVAEKYATNFSSNTPLIGWSMTKSVINALVGILVERGELSLQQNNLVPEWNGEGDFRKNITLEQLLQMSSGLSFVENYRNPLKDCLQMLFNSNDVANYAIGKPLNHLPGKKWYYSSGTTNIISKIIRNTVEKAGIDYYTFPYKFLFRPIGMYSAVMELDASGTFIGSSFMYATARDWARFGLLYLQDGIWEGKQILPKKWVQFSRTPSSISNGKYGAHFWLHNFTSELRRKRNATDVFPGGIFSAVGYEGQYVSIIPSKDLVLVRLGKGSKSHRSLLEKVVAVFK